MPRTSSPSPAKSAISAKRSPGPFVKRLALTSSAGWIAAISGGVVASGSSAAPNTPSNAAEARPWRMISNDIPTPSSRKRASSMGPVIRLPSAAGASRTPQGAKPSCARTAPANSSASSWLAGVMRDATGSIGPPFSTASAKFNTTRPNASESDITLSLRGLFRHKRLFYHIASGRVIGPLHKAAGFQQGLAIAVHRLRPAKHHAVMRGVQRRQGKISKNPP